jgi:hypothetical protein
MKGRIKMQKKVITPRKQSASRQLQQLLESDKLTSDQRAALEDAMFEVMDDLQINILESPEVGGATLAVAIRDCPDNDQTKKALEIMWKIQAGNKFKGYLKRQKAKQRKSEAESRENRRIDQLRQHRSEFFIRILQSSKRGALAALGIPENSVGIFEKHPTEAFKADDIVLVSMSGNYWDACPNSSAVRCCR